eukprot:COSAG01_NODE_1257_length_11020_cov_5.619723_7_plen_70_part_00
MISVCLPTDPGAQPFALSAVAEEDWPRILPTSLQPGHVDSALLDAGGPSVCATELARYTAWHDAVTTGM